MRTPHQARRRSRIDDKLSRCCARVPLRRRTMDIRDRTRIFLRTCRLRAIASAVSQTKPRMMEPNIAPKMRSPTLIGNSLLIFPWSRGVTESPDRARLSPYPDRPPLVRARSSLLPLTGAHSEERSRAELKILRHAPRKARRRSSDQASLSLSKMLCSRMSLAGTFAQLGFAPPSI